jgi:hypothetical protein
LPAPAGPDGDNAQSGWESRRGAELSPVTKWADKATNANNELRGHSPLPVLIPAKEVAEVGPLNGLNGKAHHK